MKRARRIYGALLAAAVLAAAAPAPDSAARPIEPSYADLADLALAAPVAAHVRVAKAIAIKGERAAGVRPDHARFYVEADLVTLIRSPRDLPARLAYVVDLPRLANGKTPRLRKGSELILLASPVVGRPAELRLAARDAQLDFTPGTAARLRSIVREAAAPGAPPAVSGVSRAFHVPGAIRGESETQIFLETASGGPISLNVLRRPGQTPLWAAATGDIVDESASAPARESLLWYRLACGLPQTLPRDSLGELDSAGRTAVAADYRLVLDQLGPCTRTRSGR